MRLTPPPPQIALRASCPCGAYYEFTGWGHTAKNREEALVRFEQFLCQHQDCGEPAAEWRHEYWTTREAALASVARAAERLCKAAAEFLPDYPAALSMCWEALEKELADLWQVGWEG